MSYGLTPSGNPLQNQLMLDQSAALQGQTRQNALNALSRGVTSLSEAPVRQGMQQNALAQSDAQTQIARAQGLQAEAAIVAPYLSQIEESANPAEAYAQVVRIVEAKGVDIAEPFETYTPENFKMVKSIYTLPPQEMTDFERTLQGLGSDEERMRAIRIRAGVEASADAQLRGQTGDRVPSGYRRTDDGNLSFIPGGPADPANKSPGFSVTTPDGTTITQGRPVGRTGQNKLDTMEIDTREQYARLQNIRRTAIENPNVSDMNTLTGNLKRMGLEWLDFVSSDSLTDEQAQYLFDVTEARGDVLENVNRTIQDITGAAMGVEEAKRIRAQVPDVHDSPRMFQAKFDRLERNMTAAIARYNMWRNMGIDARPDRPEKVASLSDIRSQMDKRFEDLAGAVESGDMSEEEANAMFASEFGL